MRSRDERIETYYHQSAWDLAERVVDLEDSVQAFMDLDDSRCKLIKKLADENDKLLSDLMSAKNETVHDELDPSRLESALRMYIAELDYDIHKSIENNEEDGLDHYHEEVDYFLRCWETAGEEA